MSDETLSIEARLEDLVSKNMDTIIKKFDEFEKTAKKSSSGATSSMSGMEKQMKSLITTIGGFVAFRQVTGFLKDSIKLFDEQAEAEAKLNATLKSTQFAAGLTSKELKNMASSLQETTRYGDEAVIGAEQLLLTFKSIGRDVFPRVLETTLDLSTAFGQDLKSSAIQLGKALEDPIAGVAALRRVGVTFSESQQVFIKSLVESGNKAEAQRFILKELETQVGGTAKAVALAGSGPMVQFQNAWQDVMELIGKGLLPTFSDMSKFMLNILKHPFFKKLPVLFNALLSPIQILKINISGLELVFVKTWEGIVSFMQSSVQKLSSALFGLVGIGGPIGDIAKKALPGLLSLNGGLIKLSASAETASNNIVDKIQRMANTLRNEVKSVEVPEPKFKLPEPEFKQGKIKSETNAVVIDLDEQKKLEEQRYQLQKKNVELSISLVSEEFSRRRAEIMANSEFEISELNRLMEEKPALEQEIEAQITLIKQIEAEKRKQIDQDELQSRLDAAVKIGSQIQSIISNVTETQINMIDREKQAQINKVKATIKGREEQAKAIDKINAEADKKKKQAAKKEKAIAIAMAVINTAQAITSALSMKPVTLGIIMAALVGVAGTAEVAKIASQQFAMGTDSAPGGIALVGERGPELVNLPKGSQVFTAGETKSLLNQTTNNTTNQNGGNIINIRVNDPATGQMLRKMLRNGELNNFVIDMKSALQNV